MSVTERHAAALARTVAAHGVEPIPADDLPALSTDALDAARARAGEQLAAVAQRRRGLADERRTADARRAEDQETLDDAAAAAEEQTARRRQLEAEADTAQQRLGVLDVDLAELARVVEACGDRDRELDELRARIESVTDRLSGGVVAAADMVSGADELEDIAGALETADLAATSPPLSAWAVSLRDGTAPIDDTAARLLDELDGAEREWETTGSGDPLADPQVIGVQAELDDARTAVAEIAAQAQAGGLGQRTKAMIDAGRVNRTRIEEQGRKADAGALQAAIDAETEALRHVGFDSMLDFHIAMSTGGTGALVTARRSTASARVTELEATLAAELRDATGRQGARRSRRAEVRAAADELVGDHHAADLASALRAVLAVPEAVSDARSELERRAGEARSELGERRDEMSTLEGERDELSRTRAHALATAVESVEVGERAEQRASELRPRLDLTEAAIAGLARELDEAEGERRTAEDEVSRLAGLHHLDDDVRSFGDALRDVVATHVEEAEEGTAVILDDPPRGMGGLDGLEGLDSADLAAASDPLLCATWRVPVVLVTSRSALVAHARRADGHDVIVVDGRRRAPRRRGWGRRRNLPEAAQQ